MDDKIFAIKALTNIVVFSIIILPILIGIKMCSHSSTPEESITEVTEIADFKSVEIITTAYVGSTYVGSRIYYKDGRMGRSTKYVKNWKEESEKAGFPLLQVNGGTIVNPRLRYYIDSETKKWFVESIFLKPEITRDFKKLVKHVLIECPLHPH